MSTGHTARASHRRVAATTLLALAAASVVGERPARAIEDLLTPRAIGMGGALRSNATGALGPLLNPAGMALIRQYSIEVLYGLGVQDLGSTIHLSIVDSVTSKVSAGLYYSYIHDAPHVAYGRAGAASDATRDGHETGLSLALPLGERLSFGITSKYTHVATEVANPDYGPGSPMGTPKRLTLDSTTSTAAADGFTMDAGLALRLGDSVSLGVVGGNLIPLRSVDAPMNLGMGLSYHGAALFAGLDVVIDFGRYRNAPTLDSRSGQLVRGDTLTTVRVNAGIEYLIAGHVPLRIGLMHDGGLPGTYLTAGVGYVHRTFGIDLGYRQKVDGGVDALLALGLRVFME